ncbi:MAG: site-2 protease family protein [Actinomycetes bacterium]
MTGRGGSFKLFTLGGIRVGVDFSWFVVLFLAIFWLSSAFKTMLSSSDTVAYLTAVATALLFFASLLAHELGHAVVAKRAGIGVARIDLWMLGGMARMDSEPKSPGEEFRIAAAGPAVSFLVAVVCVMLAVVIEGPSTVSKAANLTDDITVTPVLLALGVLWTMNLVIFFFNLLPAWPLDGGRITRAVVWKVTGSRMRATLISARLGTGLAWVMGGWGAWQVLNGSLSGIWWLLLAFFIGQAARGAVVQTQVAERVGDRKVLALMDRYPVALPADVDVERANEEWFLRYGWSWFPVVAAAGRFIGIAREEQTREAAERPGLGGSPMVSDVTDRSVAAEWSVAETTPIEELLDHGPLARNGALMALDEDGVLCGVITVEQVRAALIGRSG